jgi:3-methylcrotonyl-CoA carboxylase alpha subunit
MTIRKLLIANRGEIACRIMRTCRAMGIRSVAVYSDADRDALHVASADKAIRIGPAEAAASYLNVDAIMNAAKRTGADAIHPGYGFLSERVTLVEACQAAGMVWVGPSADAITRMGSKIESKRIAEAAGVPCVPGYHGAAQDDDSLQRAADGIGYPVLIKASAGGGGRGMRRVDAPDALRPALALARAEAQAGFGDPALLIEKLISRPRHIEVQLAGDKHGNLIHLFERECSIQRNYQKLIEEAPAPNLPEATRAALFDATVKLGRAICYDSLGTVEFIVDADGSGPWFLEMNTRLQVEHPVTECITGLDLVEWQIRIADGEALPLTQDQVSGGGAAIEVRINAEDPAAGYRPSLGAIRLFEPPEGAGIRVDSGVRTGGAVSPYYDSLLAKVIASGPDRGIAVTRISAGLGDLNILGVKTSQAFLRDIVDDKRFRAGELTTSFIPEAFPDGWRPAPDAASFDIAASIVWAERLAQPKAPGPWSSLGGFRIFPSVTGQGSVPLAVERDGEASRIALSREDGLYQFRRGDDALTAEASIAASHLILTIDGASLDYAWHSEDDRVWIGRDGHAAEFRVRPWVETAGESAGVASAGGGNRVLAAMPGQINAIWVEPGQTVAAGETVAVLEAMKLLYNLSAPVGGKVTAVYAAAGDTVAAGAVLVEIEPASADL